MTTSKLLLELERAKEVGDEARAYEIEQILSARF